MKKLVLATLALAASGAAFSQESGRVISSTPVIQQVAVTRQVCSQQQLATQPQSSGGGALLGAIVGGVIGNQIGHGAGRAAATGIGAVVGAGVGGTAEANSRGPGVSTMQNCSPQTSYENRTVGYNVTYEYNGRQHTVQMPNDPGPTVQLRVTPVGAGLAPAPSNVPLVTAPPIASADGTVITSQPTVVVQQAVPSYVYPSYVVYRPYPYYWYPPVSFNLGYVYYGGHRRWR